MVGSKGKGNASASKSKLKSLVPAVSEPPTISVEESADIPSIGEEGKGEMSNKQVKSLLEEEMDETIGGQIIGSEPEEKQQIADDMNEVNAVRAENISTYGGIEEVNDKGGIANNKNVEEDEERSNVEVPDKEKELVNNSLENKEVNTREEKKSTEGDTGSAASEHGIMDVNMTANLEGEREATKLNAQGLIGTLADHGKEECAREDAPTSNEGKEKKSSEAVTEGEKGSAASEHGVMEVNMTANLENEREATELDAQGPLGTLADHGKEECTREDATISSEGKAVPEKISRSKRKLVRKKVVKKLVQANATAPTNEAKLQPSIGNEESGEASKTDTSEHLNNEEKAGVKPPVEGKKKRKRKRKNKASGGSASVAASSDEQKLKLANDKLRNKENEITYEKDMKNDKAAKSGDQVGPSKKRRKKKAAKKDAQVVGAEDINKSGPSNNSKSLERVDSMGMIFMCSSETKKDCYRYKLFGLPAGKKDMVLKIYKGMRLFLFDFEQRLMYGIYKAAAPGGYNIEPRAFKSQFPSQVRFTVLDDCAPLPEEKFRKIIKDNYYAKKKFNCQLNSEQVKNLCKLFKETTEKSEPKQAFKSQKDAAPSSAKRDRKRKRVKESSNKSKNFSFSERKRSRRRAKEEEVRRAPVVANDRYRPLPVVYDRQTYLPPTTPATLYHQPLPAPNPPYASSYTYGRAPAALGADVYRRDVTLEQLEPGLSSSMMARHQEPAAYETLVRREYYDYSSDGRQVDGRYPSVSYAEPPASYESVVRRGYYDYSTDGQQGEYYTSAADYRPPLPPYRRY